jgi:replicative DNA helicase
MADLPVDVDAEQSLIGSVWSGLSIRDPESRTIVWDLEPGAFFITDHRAIWAGMRVLLGKSNDIPSEHALVWEIGAGKPSPQLKAQVLETLARGADALPGPLVARVRELWRRREAIKAGRAVIEAAEDLSMPFTEVSSAANSAFLSVARGDGSQSQIWWSGDMVEKLEQNTPFRTGAESEKLVYFGIEWLDDLLVGGPGNVTVLGGRPGCAKSGLGLQARNMTASHGIPAGFFSLEMDRAEIDSRDAAWWLSDPARNLVFSYKKLLREKYDCSSALGVLRERVDYMNNAMSWCHSSGVEVGTLIAAMSEAVHAYGLKLAVIDYFQYIKPMRQKGDTLASAYAANSGALKRAAQDLGIHILLLSQLNNREDGVRPSIGDLKETSQLEQDASAIPMLWKNKDGILCLSLPKHRDGETVVSKDLEVCWPCLRISGPVQYTEAAPFF